MTKPSTVTMAYGTVIFVITVTAWLYSALNNIDSGVLWNVAVPVIIALFVGDKLRETADAAKQAATQTNGNLDARVENAVTAALSRRDAARTWAQLAPTPPVLPARMPDGSVKTHGDK